MRVFKDVQLVEQLGSGMERIMSVYDKSIFEFLPNFLRVNFYFDKDVLEYLNLNAVNLFKNLKSKKISLALKEYYESDNNRRMYKFIENRKFIGFLPISVTESSSDKDILKALAYRYIGKDGILDGVMVNLFTIITEYDTLDSNRWKEPTSEAWATKIIELVQKGL